MLPLDLAPYGLLATLSDETKLEALRARFDTPEAWIPVTEVVFARSLFARRDSAAPRITSITIGDTKYTTTSPGSLGSGSEGAVYKATATDGSLVAIKRVATTSIRSASDVAIESIIQIILYNASEREKNGPYVPKLYSAALHSEGEALYIVSEWMEGSLEDACKKATPEETDAAVKEALQQLLPILSWCETNPAFRFNHRDLSRANTMYTIVDGAPRYRLIDFGVSCLELYRPTGPLLLSVDPPQFEYTQCFKPGRDTAHLILDILKQNRKEGSEVKVTPAMEALLMTHVRAIKENASVNLWETGLIDNLHGLLNRSLVTMPNLNMKRLATQLNGRKGGTRKHRRNRSRTRRVHR